DRGPAGIEIYDSTDLRQRDFSFSLGDPGVIRGLREAIPGMRVGELRRIEIPWRLAYGENGRGEIPPSTDLVFAVELLSVD
ncbi:MAG: FKBP-type peptidyl-prolyl cis-trans isomerase, partial [Phycisphaerales bacterium JB065]